jgi:hypothetical protein
LARGPVRAVVVRSFPVAVPWSTRVGIPLVGRASEIELCWRAAVDVAHGQVVSGACASARTGTAYCEPSAMRKRTNADQVVNIWSQLMLK